MVRGGARGLAFFLFLIPSLLSARGGWDDPPGGWDYVYEADAGEDAFVDRAGAQTVQKLLDGSWIGGQETYFWDGSAPGEYDSADADGRAPGGAAVVDYVALGEGGSRASVLSIEVAGDTRSADGNPFDFAWNSPANEAVYFFRGTSVPGGTGTSNVKSGLTLIARWRLKPNPKDVETPEGRPWRGEGFATGSNAGKGMISIVDQSDINVSLSITDEGKLRLMDLFDLPLPGGNPTAFLSSWVAVIQTATDPPTYRIEVYLNGAAIPVFSQEVADPPHGDESGSSPDDYIAFGLPLVGVPAAMELDYIGFKAAFVRPGDQELPPSNLQCAVDQAADPDELTLTWTIPEGAAYDSIDILREGEVIATLAGDATAYSATDFPRGRSEYALQAVAGGKNLVPLVCTVNYCPTGTAQVVIDYDRNPPAAHITWEPPEYSLSRIEISRHTRRSAGSDLLASLPADSLEYFDETISPAVGEVRYEVHFVPASGEDCGPALTRYVTMPHAERSYPDPDGGWNYVFNPDRHDPETDPMDRYVPQTGVEGALDGTWIRSARTDKWDGSKPGESTPPGANEKAPGGVEIRERPGEGIGGEDIKTLAIEDVGDPRGAGYNDPSNRKIYLARILDPASAGVPGGRLARGLTLYARFRLLPDPKDVPDPPNGEPVRDGNRGQIMVCYYDGKPGGTTNTDKSKSWAMSLDGDTLSLTDGGSIHGLIPGQWVSVWITIDDRDGSGYYHNYLYIQGETVPIRPNWRTRMDHWEERIFADTSLPFSALVLGMPSTNADAAIEIDFVKVKYGVVQPPRPEPAEGVSDLACTASGNDVTLSWRNPNAYDRIEVLRGGTYLDVLPGDATGIQLTGQPDGDHTYRVRPVKGGDYAEVVTCDVTLPATGGDELFYRGDVNQDGRTNIADTMALLGYVFGGKPAPDCLDAADTNDDGRLNVADAIRLLGRLFGGQPDFPAPSGGLCGPDPTEDSLPACVFAPCAR